MRTFLFLLALVATASATRASDPAESKPHGHLGCLFCPHCSEACFPTVTKEMEKRYCWEVETKTICIPRVRFPWQSDCAHGGKGWFGECAPPHSGRTRTVKVLNQRQYECPVCKYKWEHDGGKKKDGDSPAVPPENEVPPPLPVHTTRLPGRGGPIRAATTETRGIHSSENAPNVLGR